MRILKKIIIVVVSVLAGLAVFIFLFMQQRSFGKAPSGDKLAALRKSANFKDNSFVNLSPTATMAEDATIFKILKKSLTKDPRRTPAAPLPTLKPEFAPAVAGQPVITWFGHSSYLVQANGKNILMDPVFSERASFVQYFGPAAYPGTDIFDIENLPRIDIVVISHDHYDHLDYGTILKLREQATHFYVPLGVGGHLRHWGISADRITELDWWQTALMPGDMQLTATPARHFSGRGFIRNKTLWASYVLQTGAYSIYLGGDSGYDKHFKEIGDRFGPFDLVILENGQYDVNWPFIHMMPEQTVQASIDLKGKVLFPVHWGKFTLSVHPWNEPANRVSKKAAELGVTLTTPKIGEQIVVGSSYPAEQWWHF